MTAIGLIPYPAKSSRRKSDIQSLAREAHDLKAAWDTGNEICTRFDKPWLLKTIEQNRAETGNTPTASPAGANPLQDALTLLEQQEQQQDARLQAIQQEIDMAVYDLYEISVADRALIERELGERPPELVWQQMEGKSRAEKRKEHVRRLLSSILLHALRAEQSGIIPLVEGTGATTAEQRLRDGLEAIVGDRQALQFEDAIVQVLGRSLASWLDMDFSKWHNQLYKKRPIIWHLSSEKSAFGCLVYYHALTPDTLLKVRNVYLRPLVQRTETLGKQAHEQNDLKTASSKEAMLEELRIFDQQLGDVIASGYHPVIDDGVKHNIAPLQAAGLLRRKVL